MTIYFKGCVNATGRKYIFLIALQMLFKRLSYATFYLQLKFQDKNVKTV